MASAFGFHEHIDDVGTVQRGLFVTLTNFLRSTTEKAMAVSRLIILITLKESKVIQT